MEIICILYYIIAGSFLVISFKKNFITPNLIFVLTQVIMFIGITDYVNYANEADRQLVIIYLTALICFVLSSMFNFYRYRLSNRKLTVTNDENHTYMQKVVIWLMVIVSILACMYLFISAGGNVFIQSLKAFVGNGVFLTKAGRKGMLDVSGVGYIYQFRTIILPILTVYLISAGSKIEKRIAICIFPLMIIFILGTGQRGGFVLFVLMWVVALLFLHKYYQEDNLKKLMLLGMCFFAIFSITTILNGRVSSDGTVIGAMVTRIMDDNQACAVEGFRYIYYQPTQWGADWFAQIRDVLPGKNDYQALSVKIFAIMNGGSTAGTAPACIWGSAFYNWSWAGVTVFPAILAQFYAYIYRCFIRKESNKFRLFAYASAFVVLGMWISDGPMALFNQGFVTVMLMIWIVNFSRMFVFGNRR